MSEYLVSWTIEITADNPVEAARMALDIQRDPDSMATVFMVNGETIDLEDIDQEPAGKELS